MPDIILPDILNYSDDIGESALENPLPWDTISSVEYDKLDLVEPYVAKLREESDARIATNQDFVYIRQDIEQFKKLQADKTFSLNEREEIKEQMANQARQKARDKERAGAQESGHHRLRNHRRKCGQPGLPEPVSLAAMTKHGGKFKPGFN